MGMLWDIIQHHIDTAPYPPSIRQIAAKLDVSPTTVTNWRRDLRDLPSRENLIGIAELTGRSYDDVLEAALKDTGYRQAPQVLAVRPREQIYRDLANKTAERADLNELPDKPATRDLIRAVEAEIAALEAELRAADNGRATGT